MFQLSINQENQIIAIRQKGYKVNEGRVISETVSGSVEAMKRERANTAFIGPVNRSSIIIVYMQLMIYREEEMSYILSC